jgi:translation initiation factor 2 subunit 1
MAELKEGDLVLCTVKEIVKTTVFVKIEEDGEGTIVTSEIAPGRIRNIRDYVVPNKKIVCKVLKIDSGNVNLSLRRVSTKEKKEVLEKYEKERNAISILRSVIKERAEEVAGEIKKKEAVYEFLQRCKTTPEELGRYMKGEEIEKICKILQEKKDKLVEVKKEFKLESRSPEGIKILKSILSSCTRCDITYISAGRFVIKIKSQDYKKANFEINSALENIERLAKEKKAEFSVIEKR